MISQSKSIPFDIALSIFGSGCQCFLFMDTGKSYQCAINFIGDTTATIKGGVYIVSLSEVLRLADSSVSPFSKARPILKKSLLKKCISRLLHLYYSWKTDFFAES